MFKKGYNEMKKDKMMEGSPYEEAHESMKEKMKEGDMPMKGSMMGGAKDSKAAHQGEVIFSNAKVNESSSGKGGKNMSGGSKKSATSSQVGFKGAKKDKSQRY